MRNSTEDIATYVLFGDEAVSIYKISIKHLLKAEDINYEIGEFITVKSFFIEKNKWRNYIEIDYSDYKIIKAHLEANIKFGKKRKKRFSFFNLFE